MKERGIIFTGESIAAIRNGTKTQTRRVVAPKQPIPAQFRLFEMRRDPAFGKWVLGPAGASQIPFFQAAHGWVKAAFGTPRYGGPEQRLWVREAMHIDEGSNCWLYDADNAAVTLPAGDPRAAEMISWAHHREETTCPAMYMPRWASRLQIEVLHVRVERVQDITEADAKAEGIECQDFRVLWDSLNGEREGCAWSDNPWVHAYTFRRVKEAT